MPENRPLLLDEVYELTVCFARLSFSINLIQGFSIWDTIDKICQGQHSEYKCHHMAYFPKSILPFHLSIFDLVQCILSFLNDLSANAGRRIVCSNKKHQDTPRDK